MDQGFNDDELADIMNEIESLEQEFSEDVKPDQVEAPREATEVAETAEVVSELSQKPIEEVEQAHKHAHDDQNVHSLKSESVDHDQYDSQHDWPSTSMDFSIEGDMKMNLFFNISGKTVHLHINKGAFEIELEGGMKFSIPVDADQSHKKVA